MFLCLWVYCFYACLIYCFSIRLELKKKDCINRNGMPSFHYLAQNRITGIYTILYKPCFPAFLESSSWPHSEVTTTVPLRPLL